jgi:hypothetical protein
MFIDLFSSNPSLPVLWPCAPSTPGLRVVSRPWDAGPGGCTMLTHGTPPQCMGLSQCISVWPRTSCISPAPCGMRYAGPRHPHKLVLTPCPGRHAAREGRTSGVASTTGCKFAIWPRWRGWLGPRGLRKQPRQTLPQASGRTPLSCGFHVSAPFSPLPPALLHPSLTLNHALSSAPILQVFAPSSLSPRRHTSHGGGQLWRLSPRHLDWIPLTCPMLWAVK